MALPGDVRTITLTDGRTLAYRSYGDPRGVPCMYTTGTPASGHLGKMMDARAREMGVRWISLDKPGYGFSTFQPGRTLLDWPKDVAQLADHLGVERFAVAGESGGGPHALAVAYALGARVTTTIVLAGMGPIDSPKAVEGANRTNRMAVGLATRAPWLLGIVMRFRVRSLADPAAAREYLRHQRAAAPAADHDMLSDPALVQALVESVREGSRGLTHELLMMARPWGFPIEDIRTRVDLFHGEQDVHVPVAIARAVVAALPHCEARILPECGHAIAYQRSAEVLQCVLDAAPE